ncbi:hypothetical protein DFS34DRAFT_620148 [Phlyctochytrium arcticum]|nr:hypothetical protein DFS34DRAFT_620148 [Phlyctochytrium arcticum]
MVVGRLARWQARTALNNSQSSQPPIIIHRLTSARSSRNVEATPTLTALRWGLRLKDLDWFETEYEGKSGIRAGGEGSWPITGHDTILQIGTNVYAGMGSIIRSLDHLKIHPTFYPGSSLDMFAPGRGSHQGISYALVSWNTHCVVPSLEAASIASSPTSSSSSPPTPSSTNSPILSHLHTIDTMLQSSLYASPPSIEPPTNNDPENSSSPSWVGIHGRAVFPHITDLVLGASCRVSRSLPSVRPLWNSQFRHVAQWVDNLEQYLENRDEVGVGVEIEDVERVYAQPDAAYTLTTEQARKLPKVECTLRNGDSVSGYLISENNQDIRIGRVDRIPHPDDSSITAQPEIVSTLTIAREDILDWTNLSSPSSSSQKFKYID